MKTIRQTFYFLLMHNIIYTFYDLSEQFRRNIKKKGKKVRKKENIKQMLTFSINHL